MGFAERYYGAWNSHDAKQVAELMADDVLFEDLALGVVHNGREAVAEFAAESATFSSDYRFKVVTSQESGDNYCIEWEMSGTNDGAGAGLPATGKPYLIRGVSVGVLASGKVKRNRDYWNAADFMTQIGLVPPPAASA
jgi:steroid delta-isomerase-like uncharacterized protein